MFSSIRTAFQALSSNKTRATLTMLGTIIGVMSLVALWNLGQSGWGFVHNSLSALGQHIIFVYPKFNPEGEAEKRSHFRPIMLADVDAVRDSCPSLKDATALKLGSVTASFAEHFRETQINGCFPAYIPLAAWKIRSGRMFDDNDVKNQARVAVLGSIVARELFGAIDPIGQTVRIAGANPTPFTVIGVLREKGSYFGDNEDDRILVPFPVMSSYLGFGRQVDQIFASALSRNLIPQAKSEIVQAIRHSQKISSERQDPVYMEDLGDIARSVDTAGLGITMLLGAIAAISLLVGGIGIMNIMLVTVTERTREIGLRMALGASEFSILMQFLFEALILSLLGGVTGAILGSGLAVAGVRILSAQMHRPWPLVLNPASLAISVGFAAFIGVFFGFYPAWRASRLDPIVALRYE